MDNYKIKVKDEAESKEAQELFFELGYGWSSDQEKVVQTNQDAIDEGYSSDYQITFIFAAENGNLYHGSNTFDDYKSYVNDKGREVNLELLRDLVSLKNEKKVGSLLEGLEELREEYKDYHKDPALINGADALRALADGKEVEYWEEYKKTEFPQLPEWVDVLNTVDWDIKNDVLSGKTKFRLKPQTIKLELEIPAPYKAKIGGRDDTSFVLNIGRHQYCYKNEDDYTKARDALEAVFDSALRGTNS
ncbi:hypothetical protein V8Q18_09320 [Acinetobacter baumannii]